MTKESLRLLDANLNRLREGIRVIEDIYRYIFNDKQTATILKDLRHKSRIELYNKLLDSRDIQNDVLKRSTQSEQNRTDLNSILIANFKNVVNETDIRKSIYDILSCNSTIYKELVNYGIKAGLIETDENNLPLYKYILKDGKTIIANISGIYKDEKGNKKQINFDNVKDRFLLFKNGVDPNLINTSVKLVEKLVKIAKRISWKNKVREKVDEIENKIKQANNLNELHKIDIYEFTHILPDFIENKKHI